MYIGTNLFSIPTLPDGFEKLSPSRTIVFDYLNRDQFDCRFYWTQDRLQHLRGYRFMTHLGTGTHGPESMTIVSPRYVRAVRREVVAHL